MSRLTPAFFQRDPLICARELIGATFFWDGCEGRIVETEAYTAEGDPACHTFFRPGSRDFVVTHSAGTAYVYLNYGVHWLFNILTRDPAAPGAGDGFVLFRALQPLEGLGFMQTRRGRSHVTGLCSGPGKLTRAFGIDGSHHGQTFLDAENRGILAADPPPPVASGPRIGISRATEFPWRFTEAGSPFLSRR